MEKVQKLRQKGLSLKEIARITHNSKSTISYWCKNIFLSREQSKRLEQKRKTAGAKALFNYSEEKRRERLIQTKIANEKGAAEVGNIDQRELFLLGMALYWGEGYKKGNEELGFTNSDPHIIKFILKWFREIYQIPNKNFILRVSINSIHQNRNSKIISSWSKICGIPQNQFTKSSFVFSTSKRKYKDVESYFGTLRIKVRKGTELRRRILGSLKALENFSEKI